MTLWPRNCQRHVFSLLFGETLSCVGIVRPKMPSLLLTLGGSSLLTHESRKGKAGVLILISVCVRIYVSLCV